MGEQGRRLSPEEVLKLQEMDKVWRVENMPPQVDIEGLERICIMCKQPLHPLMNREYDGSTGGFCNKLCRKDMERKMILDGKTLDDIDKELEKFESWKPKKLAVV